MTMDELIELILAAERSHDNIAFMDALESMAAPSNKIVCPGGSIQPLLEVTYSAVDQFSVPRDGEHKDSIDRNARIPELAKNAVRSLSTKVAGARPGDIHSQVESFLDSRARNNSSPDSQKPVAIDMDTIMKGVYSDLRRTAPVLFSKGGLAEFQRMPIMKNPPGMK